MMDGGRVDTSALKMSRKCGSGSKGASRGQVHDAFDVQDGASISRLEMLGFLTGN